MKTAVLIVFAICGLSCGYYLNDEYELERLRKFLEQRQTHYSPDNLCPAPVDMVFIMDRSRSIWGPNFQKEKDFVQNIVKMFDPKEARFGVITWAEGADNPIKLGAHKGNQPALLDAIDAITQRPEIGGSTETWAALRMLRTDVLTKDEIKGSKSKPIAVLITDGASQKKTLTADEAKAVHAQDITVFAIGIKEREMDPDELRAIASNPDDNHMFMLDNWEQAASRLKEISSKLCPHNIDGCKHNRPMDLIFSLSNKATDIETTYSFDLVEGVLGNVTLGPGQMQVGLAPRTCYTKWEKIALNAHDTKSSYVQDLMRREKTFGRSLAGRFQFLKREAFVAENGAQSGAGVGRVAVLIIDNNEEINNVKSDASSLRRDGVTLIIIAVGDVTVSEASALTDAADVIHVDSYAQVAFATKKLLARLCEAQKLSS